jgi:penicillin G amidase
MTHRATIRRYLRTACACAICLCLASCFSDLFSGPIPDTNGIERIPTLTGRVEILRDKWGVSHIYAENAHDLFLAQGYVQARDRWWQMELFRHFGRGTVGELAGSLGAEYDLEMRRYNFATLAERQLDAMDAQTRARLDAFADGVNAYISRRAPRDLAVEYRALALLGITPEIKPWTAADTAVWAKALALQFAQSALNERRYQALLDELGAELLPYWAPSFESGDKPAILYPEDLPGLGSRMRSGASPTAAGGFGPVPRTGTLMDAMLGGAGFGSNAWVVDGALSASGLPLLANDPHLLAALPSLLYEIGLHSAGTDTEPPIDAVGFAFAAAPSIVMGHNAHIAWGIAAATADTWDEYALTVDENDPGRYLWEGEWVDFTMRLETIRFAGGAQPVRLTVRESVHGPVMNDPDDGFNQDDPWALLWTGFEVGGLETAALRLIEATDWGEFRGALRGWDVPVLNFLYADVAGNIGFQFAGRIPLRSAGHSGLTQAPGDSDAYLWQGFLPLDDLPMVLNPARGHLVAANQFAAPAAYFDALSAQYGGMYNVRFQPSASYGYRAKRITDLLTAKATHSVASFKTIQTDTKLISVDEMFPYLSQLDIQDPLLEDVRDWLLQWDGEHELDSHQAVLYNLFWYDLTVRLFYDDGPWPGFGDQPMAAVRLLLQEPDHPFWDDKDAEELVEDRDIILEQSLDLAYDVCAYYFGDDRDAWRWGDVHTITFTNIPLGESGIGLIDNHVNRGPIGLPGTMETVNTSWWYWGRNRFQVDWVPTMRMILDPSDWDNSVAVNSTGQTAHPADANYDDQIELWRKGEYRPMLWSRHRVEQTAIRKLTLVPHY